MEAFRRMWRGEVALVKTFWLWGVLALIVLTIGGQFALVSLMLAAPGSAIFLGLVFGVAAVIYQVTVSIGIWRSAGAYAGPRFWTVLARVVVVLSFVSLLLSAVLVGHQMSQDTHDPSRTSATVSGTLSRSDAYPFTGLWKGDCGEGFGLAIEPTSQPAVYSVSFCGPGGCFKPGSYRPNSAIVGDPDYRVIDQDTIEIRGLDGFSKYKRCE